MKKITPMIIIPSIFTVEKLFIRILNLIGFEEDIIRYQSFSMNESVEDTCTRIHLVFLLIFSI